MKAELNLLWSKSDNEIKLFRKLSEVLKKNHNVDFIEETHKHTVSFKSTTITQIANREISDLWIIMYSPSKKIAKNTFLQAKYSRDHLKNNKFKADFFQFELLSKRLELLSGSSFNFHKNTLKDGCCDSIGSYGIFYVDSYSQIDMAYSSAHILTPLNIPTNYRKSGVILSFPTFPSKVDYCLCCRKCKELNYTYNIDTFTKSLLDLEIGSILNPAFLPIIKKVLLSKKINSAFLSYINTNYIDLNIDIDFNENDIPTNILIINVDE